MDEKDKKKDGLDEKLSPFRAAAKYTSIPMTMLACTIVGYLIGAFLEKKYPTGGIFVAVFVMLGVAAGFREMLQTVKKPDKKSDESDKKKP